MAQPPLLQCSPLDGRVYILTHYRIEVLPDLKGTIVTARKRYDITDGFDRVVKDRVRYKRLIGRRAKQLRTKASQIQKASD